jgi:hypothetical protein
MDKPKPARGLLAQMELETLEEGRDWTRRRLEDKLRKLIEERGALSPPQRSGAEASSPPPAQAADGGRPDRD